MIISPNFDRHLRAALVAAIAAMGLSACATKVSDRPSAPATIQQINNAQQMDDVLDVLDKGDEKSAQRALQQMVKRNPADADAALLLESLTADPVMFLGAKDFQYRVQPGDRLPALSQRFLGSRLKFYALARYNDIKVPASLKAGQVIRIPGDAPPPSVVAPRPARADSPRAAPSKPAVGTTAPRAKTPELNPARAAQMRASGLTALNQGQVSRAVVLLGQASALDPANPLIKRDLQRALRIRRTVKGKQ
ncbi:MAG: LysM peptidoglycan-binding domain-containing protein [Sphingobium sp.]|uniref:LysM peptidoglycan-binding domain-containing protein n=1 Tax=Sphingobium sp. TaxID=1912891 RepID=UPI0029B8414A|nr:LysM peptidoglycan-binding domain-containing protein [Sphingobium sp.]MDX3909615.1 LysM peptidoglycan-binding domain-containing protein [Sphingobium sp.]